MEAQKQRKSLIRSSIVVTSLSMCIFQYSCSSVAGGSYPYAETYKLKFSEQKVIDAIKMFKNDHPELLVPKVQIENKGSFVVTDEREDSSSHWYHFYFYYKNENQIINTWTRPETDQITTLAFVGINDGLNLGNWKYINRDFSAVENEKVKKQFRDRILDSIIQRLAITP